MLEDKSFMLEYINTFIKKKLDNKRQCNFNCSEACKSAGDIESLTKEYCSKIEQNKFLKKLEQRIESLEDQNERLFYFIYFLFENFPDLFKNVLSPEQHSDDTFDKEADGIAIRKCTLDSRCGLQKEHPHPTRREMEVLILLEKGFCAKEIAQTLFISETTVITHKRNLKEKFHARNTVELISKAYASLSNAQGRTSAGKSY